VEKIRHPKHKVIIGITGKYVELTESYKSLHEALVHGALANDAKVELRYVSAEEIQEKGAESLLKGCHGILVPGGFGNRGVAGKIKAITCAREKRIPFFGICLGMQLAVLEFARHVTNLKGANSTEFEKDPPHPVIDLMPDQRGVKDKGGTMRLGAYPCTLLAGSRAAEIYKATEISERHRHRFEFNNDYREPLTRAGLSLSGTSPDNRLVEIVELPDHPYFVACQFHPEFKSRPMTAHPLFSSFVEAACRRRVQLTAGARGEQREAEATTTTVN
jgi:CTP synthase